MERKRDITNTGTAGFTLIELMIGLVVASVLMIGLYLAYDAQQKSYQLQEQVGEMQQNNRAAVTMMLPEIRMAGYDPNADRSGSAFDASCDAGIIMGSNSIVGEITAPMIHTATAARFGFSMDLNGNGDCDDGDENITFGFSNTNDSGAAGPPQDANNANGIAVNGAADLGRDTGGGFQAVAENISAIEFNYLLADGTTTLTPGKDNLRLNDIIEVQVSILSRTERPDTSYVNRETYTPASGVAWDLNGAAAGNSPDDNFRRRLLIGTIKIRNIGGLR